MYPFGIEGKALLGAFFASLTVSVFLVLTTKWHGRFSLDGTSGVQKIHANPTPRIGGVAIFCALAVSCSLAGEQLSNLMLPILLASLPAFCFGLCEDITKRVSVRARLTATMASGVIACALSGYWISYVGIPGIDSALTIVPLSVVFTAFAVSGLANAINIIDGFNGLAGGTAVICLVSLAGVCLAAGDLLLAQFCLVVVAVVFGFLLVNFPFGKLFLGDGGAYLIGFLLGWISVCLHARNPAVSPWAPLLACGYPIFETLFTILRRVWGRAHPGLPDSHHLHSLIKVAIVRRFFNDWRHDIRNASVSPFSWIIASVPAVLAVMYWNDTSMLLLCALMSFVLYAGSYWCLAGIAFKARVVPSSLALHPDDDADKPVPAKFVALDR